MSEEKASHSQVGFFSTSGELGDGHPQFTEICNALYERELISLAHSNIANPSIMKRRIGGLPYHVKSVARYMVNHSHFANPSPLKIDPHNGSWYTNQMQKCPGQSSQDEKERVRSEKWFEKHTEYGLVLPILKKSIEGMFIELDSVDMLNHNKKELHLNKHGWFTSSGTQIVRRTTPLESTQEHNDIARKANQQALSTQSITLLKPTKTIMSSACCGHIWSYKAKRSPRALTIREMRLSTQINWKSFTRLTPDK